MGSRISIIFFLSSMLLLSCKKKECDNYNTKLYHPLSAVSQHFFEQIAKDTILTAHSDKGRSESYSTKFYDVNQSWGEKNCAVLYGQSRQLTYESSLYGFKYYLQIRHIEESDFFTLSKYYDGDQGIEIVNPPNNQFTAYYYLNNSSIQTADVTLPLSMDTISIGSTTFYDVYKCDLQQDKYSFDDKTKVLYISVKYGLIRFETFDGETWDLY